MATYLRLLGFSILILFLLLVENKATSLSEAPPPQTQHSSHSSNSSMVHGTTQGSLRPQECGTKCTTRCSNTQYKKPCLFFCNKCCAKCLCVPPGTYGNKQVCPCYNNWKTKRGGPKCP